MHGCYGGSEGSASGRSGWNVTADNCYVGANKLHRPSCSNKNIIRATARPLEQDD